MLPGGLDGNAPLSNINKILVIRVDGIGDLLMTRPLQSRCCEKTIH